MRRSWLRFRVAGLLVFILVVAVDMAAYVRYRQSRTPWEQAGGMIGWSQAAIDTRLGLPSAVIEEDAPDEHAQKSRPMSGGTFRTLTYRTFDGLFVVWLQPGSDGRFKCVRSKWADKQPYY
jgi:hypothetical protein